MISISNTPDVGQGFFHRLTDRVDELTRSGAAFKSALASGFKKWSTTAFALAISVHAQSLLTVFQEATEAVFDAGHQHISSIYNRSGESLPLDIDRSNSKAWSGNREIVNGRWSRDAFYVSLSNVGHLAGGIAENHSITPEDRQPFVEHVVKGRVSGQYDAKVFSDVRALLRKS
ncbi:MAG: hypothetical protein HQL70_02255 [Magnetococcales bacterium]|nr:hypothetical protein [Magnetococcales bacterium]